LKQLVPIIVIEIFTHLKFSGRKISRFNGSFHQKLWSWLN